MHSLLGPSMPHRRHPPLAELKHTFDELCAWIEARLDGPLGWQELMQQSGLDHQTLKALFFKHASTTPMVWIRRRREARGHAGAPARPSPLSGRPRALV